MKNYILFLLLIIPSSFAQIFGYNDSLSKNLNANENDRNCWDKKNKLKLLFSAPLSDSLKETSGLVFFDGFFWTHNDDHDSTLYGLDNSGKIKRKIKLNGVVNHDWEEITQDSTYLYIGDFGNNYSGNRKDLSILKIDKTSFLQQEPRIEAITFSYENQTNFSPQKTNKTAFDCEAFVVTQDSIYLFTKEWKTATTSVYVLPNKSGHQIAQLQASWNCKGLITGATYLETEKKIMLCGYTKRGSPFLYFLYDFEGNHFFSGRKRRIDLKLRFHQIEGIATIDGTTFYLTNEVLVRKPFLRISQQLHKVELKNYSEK